MSEGLESAQWFYDGRCEGELEETGIRVHRRRMLGVPSVKGRRTEPRYKVPNRRVDAQGRFPARRKHVADMAAYSFAGRRSFDENGGEQRLFDPVAKNASTYKDTHAELGIQSSST